MHIQPFPHPSSKHHPIELLLSVVQALSLARDLDTIMKIVRHAARALTGADGATFVLKEGGNCFYAEEDAISPLWKGKRFPLELCISGWTMLHRESVAIEDIYKDPRIPQDAYRPTFVKSLVMVPIRTQDPIGAIGNYWAHLHKASDQEIKLLQALANSTSIAMENVQLYNDLENRVKQRTMELEAANKELESFSYTVSHDLRSPLNVISGFSELLSSHYGEHLQGKAKEYLQCMRDSTARMNQLIEDLLHFSRYARSPIDKKELSTKHIVDKLFTEHLRSSPHATIHIHELPNCQGDLTLITQVWANLISNALKYSEKVPNPTIEVGSKEAEKEIIYFIKDNGAGFDSTKTDKLFNVFQRLHSEKDFEGNGIGLAIIQKIITRHGGRVWAEGAKGKGATFYFSLPKE